MAYSNDITESSSLDSAHFVDFIKTTEGGVALYRGSPSQLITTGHAYPERTDIIFSREQVVVRIHRNFDHEFRGAAAYYAWNLIDVVHPVSLALFDTVELRKAAFGPPDTRTFYHGSIIVGTSYGVRLDLGIALGIMPSAVQLRKQYSGPVLGTEIGTYLLGLVAVNSGRNP